MVASRCPHVLPWRPAVQHRGRGAPNWQGSEFKKGRGVNKFSERRFCRFFNLCMTLRWIFLVWHPGEIWDVVC